MSNGLVENAFNQIINNPPQNAMPVVGYAINKLRANPNIINDIILYLRKVANDNGVDPNMLHGFVYDQLPMIAPYVVLQTEGSINSIQGYGDYNNLMQCANYVKSIVANAYQSNMNQYGGPQRMGPRQSNVGGMGVGSQPTVQPNLGTPMGQTIQSNPYSGGGIQSNFPQQPSNPYGSSKVDLAFDTRTHVRILKESNGNTTTELVGIEEVEKMNYEQHELDVAVRSSIKSKDPGKVVSNMWVPAFTQKDKQVVDFDQRELIGNIKAFKTKYLAYNDNHVKVQLFKEMVKQGIDIKDKFVEYSYVHVIPYVIDSDTEETSELLIQLYNSKSIDTFVNILDDMAIRGVDPGLLDLIVERSTEALNRVLTAGLGIKATIDSIMDDWSDLKSSLKQIYGPEQYRVILGEVNKIRETIIYSIKPLTKAQTESFLELEGLMDEIYKEKSENLFLFGHTVYTCRPNFSSSDLSIHVSENGSEVKESILPGLYKALKGIIERSSDIEPDQIKIITTDNFVLELNQGALSAEHFVIRQIK